MGPTVNVPTTYGAILMGGLLAVGFSGVVTIQCSIYFKTYPADRRALKALVASIWLLDSSHTGFVCAASWYYLVAHFGDTAKIDFIPWTIALTITFTAILTFIVQCFFAHRIFKLSHNNWLITMPIALMALVRLCAASVSTAEMIHLQSYSQFVIRYAYVFTLGLALSSVVDILIAGFLCYFLRTSRTGHSPMDHVLDSLVLYTFENGSLTCAATVVSLICWLKMPRNLVFLSLHFVISKLYANSLLATLNARQRLRLGRGRSVTASGERELPVIFHGHLNGLSNNFRMTSHRTSKSAPLEINVEKTIQRDVDMDGDPSESASRADNSELDPCV